MTSYRPGDVVLLLYPFASGQGRKQRPALVLLDTGDADVVVTRITSSLGRGGFDVELAEWQQAGLLAPSLVRVHKLLGALTPGDWA